MGNVMYIGGEHMRQEKLQDEDNAMNAIVARAHSPLTTHHSRFVTAGAISMVSRAGAARTDSRLTTHNSRNVTAENMTMAKKAGVACTHSPLTTHHSQKRWLMHVVLTMLLLCAGSASIAQQRPVQSLYMFDPLLINPAYAGTHVQLSGTAIYRNQWVNFDGAPKTFTGTVHSGFRKARVGLGLIFGNDQIGVHSDNSLYGVYSYKIPVSRRKNGGVISMGIQGGFNVLKSDYFKTTPRDGAEVGVLSKFNPNFGAGVFYRGNDFYAGFSIPYILNNKIIDIIDVEMDTTFNTSGKQQRYYYLTGGFTKSLSEQVKWMPSTLIRIQNNAPLSFDINNMFIFYDVVGLGVSYRLGDAVIGLFELQINENFHVGYAYDITMSDIRLYSNGSHEIMINYRIKLPKIHQGLPCPSYW